MLHARAERTTDPPTRAIRGRAQGAVQAPLSFPAANTLFNGLANHPQFNTVDWSHLRSRWAAAAWPQAAISCAGEDRLPHLRGRYGLSETSPLVSCRQTGSRLASSAPSACPHSQHTYMRILDDDGMTSLATGQPGEIAISGPAGHGWLLVAGLTRIAMSWPRTPKTGTSALWDERGYFKVDRKEAHGAGQRLQRLPQ